MHNSGAGEEKVKGVPRTPCGIEKQESIQRLLGEGRKDAGATMTGFQWPKWGSFKQQNIMTVIGCYELNYLFML